MHNSYLGIVYNIKENYWAFVLLFTGIELFFFVVASMGLRFEFVLKSVLIMQGCFSYCWAVVTQESSPFLLLIPSPQRIGWWCKRSWEKTQLEQPTTAAQRDIPCHMISCSAYKSGGRRSKGGTFRVMALSLQVTIMHDEALFSWRRMNTCLPIGSTEWIPNLSLLACTAFALPVKLSLSQSTNFLTFTLLLLSPLPPGGSEQATAWYLVASQG